MARSKSSERGSVTVEFALVVLPLFAILFLAMDVAWMIFGWACLQEAAREGVRYAVTRSGEAESTLDSTTRRVVEKYSFGFAKAGEISVDYYPSTGYSSAGVPATLDGTVGSTSVGNLVKVTINGVTLKSFAPLFRSANSYQLSASATDILQ